MRTVSRALPPAADRGGEGGSDLDDSPLELSPLVPPSLVPSPPTKRVSVEAVVRQAFLRVSPRNWLKIISLPTTVK